MSRTVLGLWIGALCCAFAPPARALTVLTCVAPNAQLRNSNPPPVTVDIPVLRDPSAATTVRLHLLVGDADTINEGVVQFVAAQQVQQFPQAGDYGTSNVNNPAPITRTIPAAWVTRPTTQVTFVKQGTSAGYTIPQACIEMVFPNPAPGVVAGGPVAAPTETFCPEDVTLPINFYNVNGTNPMSQAFTVVVDRPTLGNATAAVDGILFDADSFSGGISEGTLSVGTATVNITNAANSGLNDFFSVWTAPLTGLVPQRGTLNATLARNSGFSGYRAHRVCLTVNGLTNDVVDAGPPPPDAAVVDPPDAAVTPDPDAGAGNGATTSSSSSAGGAASSSSGGAATSSGGVDPSSTGTSGGTPGSTSSAGGAANNAANATSSSSSAGGGAASSTSSAGGVSPILDAGVVGLGGDGGAGARGGVDDAAVVGACRHTLVDGGIPYALLLLLLARVASRRH